MSARLREVYYLTILIVWLWARSLLVFVYSLLNNLFGVFESKFQGLFPRVGVFRITPIGALGTRELSNLINANIGRPSSRVWNLIESYFDVISLVNVCVHKSTLSPQRTDQVMLSQVCDNGNLRVG